MTAKCKQSLFFPPEILADIRSESYRLDRSLSWVVQRAWRTARKKIMAMPSDSDKGMGVDVLDRN